jgi:hypothetical protein
MKEIFEKLVQLGIIALLFVLCQTCTNDYIEGGDKKAITNYQKMIKDNSSTTGEFESEYKETTIKIAGLPVKMYHFKYHFNVDNETYNKDVTLTTLPTSSQTKVFYLKENPNISTLDPQKDLKEEKEKNTSKSSLYWAIGWGVLAVLMLIGFISHIREVISNKKLSTLEQE